MGSGENLMNNATNQNCSIISTLLAEYHHCNARSQALPGNALTSRLRLAKDSISLLTSAGGACNSADSEAEPRNQRWRSARSLEILGFSPASSKASSSSIKAMSELDDLFALWGLFPLKPITRHQKPDIPQKFSKIDGNQNADTNRLG